MKPFFAKAVDFLPRPLDGIQSIKLKLAILMVAFFSPGAVLAQTAPISNGGTLAGSASGTLNSGEIDWELFCIDGSVVRAHQSAAGASEKKSAAR